MKQIAIAFVFALLLCFVFGTVHAQTIGLHLASIHAPARDFHRNTNPGVYVITDNGLTFGVYRNTLGRTSVYAGVTIDSGPFSLTVGATTGYQKRAEHGKCYDGVPDLGLGCDNVMGVSNGVLLPVVSPSIRLPAVAGITPRISYIPSLGAGSSSAFHLSVEREF